MIISSRAFSCGFLLLTLLAQPSLAADKATNKQQSQPASQEHKQRYHTASVSFIVPKGWKVSETDNFDDYEFISIEKEGMGTSGMVNVFVHKNSKKKNLIDTYANVYNKAWLLGTQFSPTKLSRYGRYKALSRNGKFSIMTIPHVVRLFEITLPEAQVIIYEHGATEDSNENLLDFAKIKTSFKIKGFRNLLF